MGMSLCWMMGVSVRGLFLTCLIGYITEGGGGEEGRLEGDEDVNLLLIDFSNELDGLYGEGRCCWWKYPHEQV